MANRKNKKPEKDKRYSELDDEFMTEMLQEKDEAKLRTKIAETALNQAAVNDAKKADPDLQTLKEQVKTANEPYAIATKTNRQRIAFIREVLRSRGKDAGDFSTDEALEQQANAAAN